MAAADKGSPDEPQIEAFDGTVTIRFWDAVVASSDEAKIVRTRDGDPSFFIPFDHIYFDFLQKTDRNEHIPRLGKAVFWRASAMNRAADDFMWSLVTPELAFASLADHGTFDDKIARIEAVPAGGGAQVAVEL